MSVCVRGTVCVCVCLSVCVVQCVCVCVCVCVCTMCVRACVCCAALCFSCTCKPVGGRVQFVFPMKNSVLDLSAVLDTGWQAQDWPVSGQSPHLAANFQHSGCGERGDRETGHQQVTQPIAQFATHYSRVISVVC